MLKKGLIGVSIFAVALMLALTYITTRYVDQEEIARLENERIRLAVTRDSINLIAAVVDSLQRVYQQQINEKTLEVERLRQRVDDLERQRADQQLSVRRLRRKEDLQQRLAATFPEMARSDWGVTEVVHEETGLGIEYLLVPLWFSETFIIDHQNAESYKAQRDTLLLVDTLRSEVLALKDSLFVREQQRAAAYKTGYDDAYVKYDALLDDHLTLLKQPPKVSLFPGKSAVLVSGALGAAAGAAVGAAASSIGND